MKPDTWMPLYVNDYLGDTMHLTTEQHGAYMLLLMAAWKRGGPLPDDDNQLAGIARMTPAAWRKVASVIRPFFARADGSLIHGRVAREVEKARKLSEARRESGSKGGRPKKQIESNEKPIGYREKNQTALQTETPARVALPSPSPDPIGSSEANASLSPSDETRKYPPAFEVLWKAYPHFKGRSSKPKAYGFWRRFPAAIREQLPAAIARYARDGREPRAECGAPAMQRWLSEERFEDWLASPSTAPKPITPEVITNRVQRYRDTGEWLETWGPKPEDIAA